MMDIIQPTCTTNFTFIAVTKIDSEVKSLSRTITVEKPE